ncbi:MAG: MerR family transcriptional regulator [Mycobacterium sp.]
MTGYRIGELAEASGVSIRNIRAYRERGLLDPPARVGRAAIYSDAHLAQLRVINQLLSKGFTSSHIADFFSAMRTGDDLVDVLGLHDLLDDISGDSPGGVAERLAALPLGIEATRAEARRMVATGMAGVADGELMLIDPSLVQIVLQAPDRQSYLAIIVEVFTSAQEGVAATAGDVAALLGEAAAELVSADPPRVSPVESVRVLRDYRALATIVIARQVEHAMRGPAMQSSA